MCISDISKEETLTYLDRTIGTMNGAFWSDEESRLEVKLLKGLVGAWGFEPQTPTVSILLPA